MSSNYINVNFIICDQPRFNVTSVCMTAQMKFSCWEVSYALIITKLRSIVFKVDISWLKQDLTLRRVQFSTAKLVFLRDFHAHLSPGWDRP